MFLFKPLASYKHKLDVKFRMSRFFSFRFKQKRLFFPGCSLSSASPELITQTFQNLRIQDPNIGLWLSCCGMPIKKFVNKQDFEVTKQKLEREIKENDIEEVITSCGNCFKTFLEIRSDIPNLKVSSVYNYLTKSNVSLKSHNTEYIVHHPCSARSNQDFQDSFKKCVEEFDLQIKNTRKKHPLLCCLVNNDSQANRISQIKDQNVITYCGHCTKQFQDKVSTKHILQVLFQKEEKMKNASVLFSFKKIKKSGLY